MRPFFQFQGAWRLFSRLIGCHCRRKIFSRQVPDSPAASLVLQRGRDLQGDRVSATEEPRRSKTNHSLKIARTHPHLGKTTVPPTPTPANSPFLLPSLLSPGWAGALTENGALNLNYLPFPFPFLAMEPLINRWCCLPRTSFFIQGRPPPSSSGRSIK